VNNEKYFPEPLMSPSERPKLKLAVKDPSLKWRGGFLIYQLLLFHLRLAWIFIQNKLTPTSYAVQLRIFLETMGSLWISVGQMIALRRDVISLEISEELAKLDEIGSVQPFSVVRAIIEKDLNIVLENEYEQFGEFPFASTVITQTHRALLKSNHKWVSVKIVHSYAEALFNRDLQLINITIRFLHWFNVQSCMNWMQLYSEINAILQKELDLRYEASSLKLLRKNMRTHEGIHIQKVYEHLSNIHVLTNEYFSGALMSDYINLKKNDPIRLNIWLEKHNIDADKVAKRLFQTVYRQIFEDNFFHSDVYPGNIVLLRNSHLGFINCRNVAWQEAERLEKLRMSFEALAYAEYSTAAEIFFLLASKLPIVDLAEVKFQIIRSWRVWEIRSHLKDLPYDEKSINYMFRGLYKIIYTNQFATDWSNEKIGKTLSNLDMSLAHLKPELNYIKWMQQYFSESKNRQLCQELQVLPKRLQRTTVNLEQNRKVISEYMNLQQTIVRRQSMQFQNSTSKIGHVIAAILSFSSLLMFFVALFLTITCIRQNYPSQFDWSLFVGNDLTGLMASIPTLGNWQWLVILLIVFFTLLKLIIFKFYFQKKDIKLPNVSVSA
jgi:ubiquinone biosynthesis protein